MKIIEQYVSKGILAEGGEALLTVDAIGNINVGGKKFREGEIYGFLIEDGILYLERVTCKLPVGNIRAEDRDVASGWVTDVNEFYRSKLPSYSD